MYELMVCEDGAERRTFPASTPEEILEAVRFALELKGRPDESDAPIVTLVVIPEGRVRALMILERAVAEESEDLMADVQNAIEELKGEA